jgi:poly(A) polymerase
MKITGDWLDHPGTQALCAALEAAGHRALLSAAVSAMPFWMNRSAMSISPPMQPLKTSLNIAESAGFKVVPTGIDHGTVTVIAGGKPHEVTTFRRDVETDGRRAVVAFSTRSRRTPSAATSP